MNTNINRTPAPDWLSLVEAADRLGVSTKTVRRRIAEGDLIAYRLGPRLLRVDAASVNALGRPLTATPARSA